MSSPERNIHDRLTRKKERLQRKERKIKEELFSQGRLPSLKLNLTSEGIRRARYKFDDDDEDEKDDNEDDKKIRKIKKLVSLKYVSLFRDGRTLKLMYLTHLVS